MALDMAHDTAHDTPHRAPPKRAVLIAGATASGKSALALALAQEVGGTIINADSMQVYRDLRIITARPTPQEEADVPHRLYGHVDAADNYSTGRWCVDAGVAVREAQAAARLPVVVGGTGLYFKALTHGLAEVPPIPPELRSQVRARLQTQGITALHAELGERDPETARRLRPGDRTRITRALEVVVATGRSLADWQRAGMTPVLDAESAVRIFLDVQRSELYARIDTRFDAMLAAGALEEVRTLLGRDLDPALPAMKAHGVPWLIRHLQGAIDLAAAADAAKRDTRRYTKRQATWFRHQLPDWTWLAPDQALGEIRRALGR
jgi:tRNA dimethylallyltransferase